MSHQLVGLRYFGEHERIFDEDETKHILKFFFVADRAYIETLDISVNMKRLAQGLLVEALDKTFAMGWMEGAVRWVAHPGLGVRKALQKLALRAARHWFRHLKEQSLIDAPIYERVRERLAVNFRSEFRTVAQVGSSGRSGLPAMAMVDFGPAGGGSVQG